MHVIIIILGLSAVFFSNCCQDSEQRQSIYIKGCVPQFEKWLQENLTVVAGIFIGIALLQVGIDGRCLLFMSCISNLILTNMLVSVFRSLGSV